MRLNYSEEGMTTNDSIEGKGVGGSSTNYSVALYRRKSANGYVYGVHPDDCRHCKKTILRAIRGYLYVSEVSYVL